MKKLSRLLQFLFLLSILLAVPSRIKADTTFNLTAHTGSYTVQSLPDRSVTFKINLSTDTTQTIYPVAMNYFVAGRSYTLVNPWITFDQSQYLINHGVTNSISFTLTTPPKDSIYDGEYYQVIGFSNQPFTGVLTSNPPIILGIPMVIQIYGGLQSGPAPGLPSAYIPPKPVTNPPIPVPSVVFPKKFVPIKESPTVNYPIHSESLYSSISAVNFSSHYNPTSQTITLEFNLKNTGNISSTPTGFINITNVNGQTFDHLLINPNELTVLPNSERKFDLTYKPKEQLFGRLQADLWLGYKNSQTQQEPQKVATTSFFYIPKNIFFIVLPLFIFLLLLFRLPRMISRPYLRYFTFLLIVSVIGSIFIYDLRLQRLNPQILGQSDISVNAAVGENYEISGDISSSDGSFTFSSNRVNVWQLFALYKSFMDPLEVVTGGNGTILGPYIYPLNPEIRAFMVQTVPF